MPIDYSKWDNLDLSSDEDEKPAPVRTAKYVDSIEPAAAAAKPKDRGAQGASTWNAGNYHWEEQKLDEWAAERLKSMFDQMSATDEIEFNDQRMIMRHVYGMKDKAEGDAWTHIRKGATVVGYNFEMVLTVMVTISDQVKHGAVMIDFMVDNDPDVTIQFSADSRPLPMDPMIKTRITKLINEKLGHFVKELESRGAQKTAAASAAKPKAAAHAAAKHEQTPTVSPVTAKSHFGGHVQVGGHNPNGIKL